VIDGAPPRQGPWHRLSRKINEVGLRYTLALLLRVVIPPAVLRLTRMVILELVPTGAVAPIDRVDAGAIRWASPIDVDALQALGHPAEVLERRLAEGARACLFAEAAAVLGYVWFEGAAHDEENLGVRFTLTAGEIWLFDAMVEAEQRGRGIYPKLLRAAAADLRREGFRRILIAIEVANRNSLRAHQAGGAVPIATVAAVRILGVTIVRHGRGIQLGWTGRRGYVRVPTSHIA
jgi:GNAT superfamily N-acetyltransferase